MNGQEKIGECGQDGVTAADELPYERYVIESCRRDGNMRLMSAWNVVVRDRVTGAKATMHMSYCTGGAYEEMDYRHPLHNKGDDPSVVEGAERGIPDELFQELRSHHLPAVKKFKAAISKGGRGAQSPARSEVLGDQRS